MKINPLLIFPPGWSPFSPYSALPVLKGYLDNKEINSKIIDLNLEFYDNMFSKAFLSKCYKKCSSKFQYLNQKETLNDIEKQEYLKYSKAILLNGIENHVDSAKKIIKTDEFYNKDKAEFAKHILLNSLILTGTAYNGDFKFNGFSLKYSLKSTKEVIASLEDDDCNPFIEFYKNGIIEELKISDFNFISLSVTGNSQLIPTLTLAKLIKEECPNIKHISIGGNYITRIVESWDKNHDFFKYIDSVITFEGEKSLYLLIKSLENNLSLDTVPNLVFVKNGVLYKNKNEILDKSDFSRANYDDLLLDNYYMPKKVLPIFSSRSCFCKCAFCSIPYSSKDKYRSLDMYLVYENMKYFYNKYNVKYFAFVDETFTSDKMTQLSELIKSEGLPLEWYGETRFSPIFTEDFCKNLYNGGCRKLQFGLESYNQNILDKMNKCIKKDWIYPTIENCFKAGIAVHMFFMVGFPGETETEALNTIQFTRSMVQMSSVKYNNPNTTFGWDTFGLDKHSDVWLNPSKYGVIIKQPSNDNDLTIQYDFEVKSGMSQKIAKSLTERFNKDPYHNIKGQGLLPFHDIANNIYSEEEKFLTNINETYNIVPQKKLYPKKNILKNGSYIDFKLNNNINITEFNYDISRVNLSKQKKYGLFNLEKNIIYLLDKSFNDLISILKSQQNISVLVNSDNKEILEELLFYSFIYIKTKDNYGLFDFNSSNLVFNKNIHCFKMDEDHDLDVELFCYETGKQLRINDFSYDILKLFDGTFNSKQLYEFLISENIDIEFDIYSELISIALNANMINIVD